MERDPYESRPDHYGTGREPFRKKSIFPMTLLLFALLIGANLVSVAFLMGYSVGKQQNETASTRSSQPTEKSSPDPAALAAGLQESLAEVYAGEGRYVGVVLSADGYILTTAPADQLEKVAVGGKVYRNVLTQGTAPALGLSVIKIDGHALQPVSMGLCALVSGSEEQLIRLEGAGGAARWLEPMEQEERELGGSLCSVLEGSYSADELLLNDRGQLVGLCVSTEKGIVALPTEELLNLAVELMVFGSLDSPYGTGVELSLLDEAQSLYWDLPGNLMISRIPEDSFALAAGLREGDVLLKIEGVAVDSPEDLWSALAACKDSGSITLTIYRGSGELELCLDTEP